MNVGLVANTYSGITGGTSALNTAKTNSENAKFSDLVARLQAQDDGSVANCRSRATNQD